MELAPKDFAARYAAMSESELMGIAQEYETLRGVAQSTLRAEFAKRKLDPPVIEHRVEPPRPEARELVTVGRYRDLAEAIVARSLLQAEGIESWIQDENLIRIDWGYSNAIGGMRLQVGAENQAAAIGILAQAPDRIAFAEDGEYIQPQCSQCGSMDLSLRIMTNIWVCGNCGARGQIAEDDEEASSSTES
jgi:hypothetical protein